MKYNEARAYNQEGWHNRSVRQFYRVCAPEPPRVCPTAPERPPNPPRMGSLRSPERPAKPARWRPKAAPACGGYGRRRRVRQASNAWRTGPDHQTLTRLSSDALQAFCKASRRPLHCPLKSASQASETCSLMISRLSMSSAPINARNTS